MSTPFSEAPAAATPNAAVTDPIPAAGDSSDFWARNANHPAVRALVETGRVEAAVMAWVRACREAGGFSASDLDAWLGWLRDHALAGCSTEDDCECAACGPLRRPT